MVDPNKIITEISDLETARKLLPIWTDWGIEDYGVLIHSLGVTYLTLLGDRLGYVSVAEVPAPCKGQYAFVGDNVRSDSVWFERTTQVPLMIAEFERYSGKEDGSKLENKVRNLLLAQHRWETKAELLILAYWTKKLVSLPQNLKLDQIIKQGFTTKAGEIVKGNRKGRLFLFQFFMKEKNNLLYLSNILTREH